MVQSMNQQDQESVNDENCSDDDDDSFAGIERINEAMAEKEESESGTRRIRNSIVNVMNK